LLAPFEGEPALDRCRARCLDLAGRLERVQSADPDGGLQWFEAAEQSCAVHFTPFAFGAQLAARIEEQGGSWVFASASLAVGDDFSHFTSRLGIEPAIEAALPSPFDYRAQAALYLPPGLPEPQEEGFTEALLEAIYPLVLAAEGGAFLLFTSHRALGEAERWLAGRQLPGPRFVQGGGSRSRLLEEFRAAGNGVLLGTGSFWQGVDVRGPALRMVVIDKLPFAVPGDPLVQARIEAIRQSGGDPFREFQLPEAVLALKQGVGRLIRDFDDRGLVVIGDPRLRSRAYGRVFLESLPAFTRIAEPAAALAYAATLAAAPARLTA
jgi:ATP-dependent DNA helicase DinG